MTIQRPKADDVTLQFSSTTVHSVPTGFVVNDYAITMPGEYDVGNVGFEVGEGYAVLHGDNLKLLVLDPSNPKLSNSAISEIEDITLVVTPTDEDADRRRIITGILGELEPQGVVVLGSADDAKVLTGKTVEAAAKAKILPADFTGDELRVWAIA